MNVLVHLAAGVGNVVLATPLLVALSEAGHAVDVLLDADYPPTADLLGGWGVVRRVFGEGAADAPSLPGGPDDYDALVPAVPPFYWPRFAHLYADDARVVTRPPGALFYTDEQEFYFSFARSLGVRAPRPVYRLPVAASDEFGVGGATLVLAPGCKGGLMRAKRWPHFAELAARFADVAVVGTEEDLYDAVGARLSFPAHARLFVGKLTLRETASLMAAAGAVVANDSGLAHVAAAVGTPVLMIFGPTPDRTLGRPAPNVRVLRAGLPCEPCWFGAQLRACAARLDCLHALTVAHVEREARELLAVSC